MDPIVAFTLLEIWNVIGGLHMTQSLSQGCTIQYSKNGHKKAQRQNVRFSKMANV